MARTVEDLVALLDVLVGYDPDDPITAHGAAHIDGSYKRFLDADGLRGARLGILRESIGIGSEPDSEDFAKVDAVFARSIAELKSAGAVVVDPIVIPDLKELLDRRGGRPDDNAEAFANYFGRNRNPPFASIEAMVAAPEFEKLTNFAKALFSGAGDTSRHYAYLVARDELMHHFLKVMADHDLDAIVLKTNEHQPTLIEDGTKPPFVNTKGAWFLNTFLVYVPVVAVPAGFTVDEPTGRHHVHGQAVRRRHDAEARLRLRAGHPSPPLAEHYTRSPLRSSVGSAARGARRRRGPS